MSDSGRDLTTDQFVERLRKAASIWFKNDDLLLLEELIRRVGRSTTHDWDVMKPHPGERGPGQSDF